MAAIWISAILLALIRSTVSDYNPAICSILEESCGLIPPPLPRNFELKAEHVDHIQNYTIYEEMYFDYTNSRAKYKYLAGTFEFNYLFDYHTEQVVEWMNVHPGVSIKRDPLSSNCEAVNMEDSKFSFIFGYQDWIYDHPKMFNSFESLRYGGDYLYAANGTEQLSERNLPVNRFIGCLYDDSINATMFNKFYFADTTIVQPSGGTPSTIVTGSDDKPLSVPVKMKISGGTSVGDDVVPFDKTMSISWFKGNPLFQPETFQIPPWIHCEKYRGRKDIPQLPTAFSTRLTVTKFMVDILGDLQPDSTGESYEEIYYDLEKRLARRDFTPNQHTDTDIFSKFGSYTPVSTIYDFNEGLRYTINKPSGRCYISPIMDNEYFDMEEQLLYRKLARPEEIFLMQMDDMEYKGKAFARDIECDVWNGKYYHKYYNATFVKETYFSTNGWHENVDGNVEYGIPVKNVLIQKELNGEQAEGVWTYNFLKFKNRPPKIASFDVKNCVEHIDHKRFAIQLMLNDENSELVFTYKFFFLEAAQLYIANQTQINTPLRVQRLHLRHQPNNDNRVFLVFSLLDKANLKLPMNVPEYGKDLQEATVLLQQLIEAGNFSVQFKNPKKDEPIAVIAGKGSLYTLTPSGNLTPAPLKPASLRVPEKELAGKGNLYTLTPAPLRTEMLRDTEKEVVTYEEHKGMTGGHLALLSFAMLFIGIGIGIALMYLYLRVYSERHVDDRIHMAEKASTSTGLM